MLHHLTSGRESRCTFHTEAVCRRGQTFVTHAAPREDTLSTFSSQLSTPRLDFVSRRLLWPIITKHSCRWQLTACGGLKLRYHCPPIG